MNFETALNKMRAAAKEGKDLCAVRKVWLQEAAEMASFCFCTMFESDYICLINSAYLSDEEREEFDGDVFYTNDVIDTDETRQADDFMLFDEEPCAAYSADGSSICVSIDPVEGQEVLNG